MLTSPPKVIWEERVATPTSENTACASCIACTMRNEALRKRCGSLRNVTELLGKISHPLPFNYWLLTCRVLVVTVTVVMTAAAVSGDVTLKKSSSLRHQLQGTSFTTHARFVRLLTYFTQLTEGMELHSLHLGASPTATVSTKVNGKFLSVI